MFPDPPHVDRQVDRCREIQADVLCEEHHQGGWNDALEHWLDGFPRNEGLGLFRDAFSLDGTP
jgi:hypothetical protein